MKGILAHNIEDVIYTLGSERTFDSGGELALHPAVKQKYIEKGYDALPKAEGKNGLVTSARNIRVVINDGKTYVYADFHPARYYLGQAMRDVVKEKKDAGVKLSEDEIIRMSPDMTNGSIVVVTKINGEYFLVPQIKGEKVLGGGDFHAALVAGNIEFKYFQPVIDRLTSENKLLVNISDSSPFTAALKVESKEEIGLDASPSTRRPYAVLVNERETGQINFATIEIRPDFEHIRSSYEKMTMEKLRQDEKAKLEVEGIAKLPVQGFALLPLEKKSGLGLKGLTCYRPTRDKLVDYVDHDGRNIRPYTAVWLDFLSDPKNVKWLIEKAGW